MKGGDLIPWCDRRIASISHRTEKFQGQDFEEQVKQLGTTCLPRIAEEHSMRLPAREVDERGQLKWLHSSLGTIFWRLAVNCSGMPCSVAFSRERTKVRQIGRVWSTLISGKLVALRNLCINLRKMRTNRPEQRKTCR